MADLDRSTAFYKKLFGFTDLPAPVAFARWLSMGEGKREIQTRPDGVQQIFVQDPDGYWIEINDALKK